MEYVVENKFQNQNENVRKENVQKIAEEILKKKLKEREQG